MELSDTGVRRQPFTLGGKPVVVVKYAAQDAAVRFLHQNYTQRHGLALLQGPPESGKATVARRFARELPKTVSRVLIDGQDLGGDALLVSALRQLGYQLDLQSINERLNMLRVVVMQQAAAGAAPVLIVRNVHGITASAMQILCELAACKAGRDSALRIVLMSDRSIGRLISAPDLKAIARRVSGLHHLGPMAGIETRDYLHEKLAAAGAQAPDTVFPDTVCADIYGVSNGWPGLVDRMAMAAIATANACPISCEHVQRIAPEVSPDPAPVPTSADEGYGDVPRLMLTRDGKPLGEMKLDQPRLLIGRAEHNDLRFNSKMISRHHAMFVRHGATTLLMDLNSANGTLVNSRRISNHVMRDNDIVSLGSYRIKFLHASAERDATPDPAGAVDTVIMKTLDDVRREHRDESNQTMPKEVMEGLLKGTT